MEPPENSGANADKLVPIRLEFVSGDTFVNELFTWNLRETAITPTEFATQLVADLGLASQNVASIAASIQDQLAAASASDRSPGKPGRDNRDAPSSSRHGRHGDEGQDHDSDEDSRRIVKLSVRVGRVLLKDQFEWDVSNVDNSPEAFAEALSADLGLSRDFVPVIAHGVREQLRDPSSAHRRHVAGGALNGRTAIRPPSAVSAFEPIVECLSLSQQDNIQKKELREARLARKAREPVQVKAPRATGKRRLSAADMAAAAQNR